MQGEEGQKRNICNYLASSVLKECYVIFLVVQHIQIYDF